MPIILTWDNDGIGGNEVGLLYFLYFHRFGMVYTGERHITIHGTVFACNFGFVIICCSRVFGHTAFISTPVGVVTYIGCFDVRLALLAVNGNQHSVLV